jgi:hypothetical protein
MLRRVGFQGVNENVCINEASSTDIVVDVPAVKRACAAEMPERQFTIAPGNVGDLRETCFLLGRECTSMRFRILENAPSATIRVEKRVAGQEK